MDCEKIGAIIRAQRKEKGLTQNELAKLLTVSDKAVSKWERGTGCPDVSLLGRLSDALGVNIAELLEGELGEREAVGGNLKKLLFYVCPVCGNIITAEASASVACCGKKLEPLEPKKAAEDEKLKIELIENEFFISSGHEMTKEHYISFVALVTGDTVMLRKLYPEWNMETRMPRFAHGMLVWYCTKHSLMYQLI